MNHREAATLIVSHLRTQFPKRCRCCGRVYGSLADYSETTASLGAPMAYDADVGDWTPNQPLGGALFSNCPCGSTLVLSTEEMKRWTQWRLLAWVRLETRARGISPTALLVEVKDEVRAMIAGRRMTASGRPMARRLGSEAPARR